MFKSRSLVVALALVCFAVMAVIPISAFAGPKANKHSKKKLKGHEKISAQVEAVQETLDNQVIENQIIIQETLDDVIIPMLEECGNSPGCPYGGLPKTGQTLCYDSIGADIACGGTGQDGEYQKGPPSPTPRFVENNNEDGDEDGTVTDRVTGLIWLKNANRFGTRSSAEALSDCNTLADDGSDLTDGSSAGDWRLPNINELQSLKDYSLYEPAVPTIPFTNVQSSFYWSSTTVARYPDAAWSVHFSHGNVQGIGKSDPIYVWPVRSGN